MKLFFKKTTAKIIGNKKEPELIILGTQKSGTTSLFDVLNNLPEFNGSLTKEVHFFDINYKNGYKWYLNNFAPSRQKIINFEASPSYLFYPFVPQRICDFNKNIKLIIILRDPIERAFSAWNMYKKLHSINYPFTNKNLPDSWGELLKLYPEFPTFEQIIDFELNTMDSKKSFNPSIIARGKYAEQIERYYKLFDKMNILILDNNDLKTNKVKIINKVYSFMNIDKKINTIKSDNKNIGIYKSDMKNETYNFLKQYYQKPEQDLQNLLGKKMSWM